MSELHKIDSIVFGGEKYTVGVAGEIPEGLIDPWDIEWIGSPGYSSGVLRTISPVGIPVKLPDIESKGNYITTIDSSDFGPIAKVLHGVILPSHLVEVPSSLFRRGQLEFVEFGDHVTSIENWAFDNNQLTSVVTPDSLTSIGSYAFRDNQLTSVVFGNSLTSIGDSAFGNNQLTSVVLPDSVTSIENNAFRYNQLTSLVLPDSLTSIRDWAFNDNPLEEVSIHIDTTYNSSSFPNSAVITVREE